MRLCSSVLLLLAGVAEIESQSIITVAGGGSDDNRPATSVFISRTASGAVIGNGREFNFIDLAVAPNGDIYLALQYKVRKISRQTGLIATVAGNGARGFSGDGGPATLAALSAGSIAVDPSGNLFIADSDANRIRKVDAQTGVITTVAGNGGMSFGGDGGPATRAPIYLPTAIATDAAGNIYVANNVWTISAPGSTTNVRTFGFRVRKVDAATGIIRTLAGNGTTMNTGDGGPATAASLSYPVGLAVDGESNVYVATGMNSSHESPLDYRIRKITSATGTITTIAGTGSPDYAGDGGPATAASFDALDIAVDASGNIYVADGKARRLRRIDPATGTIQPIAGNGSPSTGDAGPALSIGLDVEQVAIGADGTLYTSDRGPRDRRTLIREIDWTHQTLRTIGGGGSPVLGDGGPATAALLSGPSGVGTDRAGRLFIADYNASSIRVRDPKTGTIATYAGSAIESETQYDDDIPATQARIRPSSMTVHEDGTLYFSDDMSSRIRKVDAATGMITTIAGTSSAGFSGDGGPATAAQLLGPRGLAVSRDGTLYILDGGNYRIRKVDAATGIITTVAGDGSRASTGDGGPATAGGLFNPVSIALDSDGTLFVAEGSDGIVKGGDRIRRVDAITGIIATVVASDYAGGANVLTPLGMAVDAEHNLYFIDRRRSRVMRRNAATGAITTHAGNGIEGMTGDAGPAVAASLSVVVHLVNAPSGLHVDRDGNLFIAETGGQRVRMVSGCLEVQAPSLVSPSSGASGVALFPRLAWMPVKGAFRYDLHLDSVNPPQKKAAEDLVTTTFSPSNLEPLTTYYWRAVAKGDPFCTPLSAQPSEVRAFTTASACDPPGAIGVP